MAGGVRHPTQSSEELLSKTTSTLSLRAAGALVGLAAGRALALRGAADGGLVLTRILAEELAAGRRDLRQLAHRWVECYRGDVQSVDLETAAALEHLARHAAPPAQAAGRGSDPLVRCVPVALAAFDAPRTLASATFHIASLTHPDPLVAWAAVALNVALARFLQGKRDFVPDVIEALRANEVPGELLTAVRRVPICGAALSDRNDAGPGRALDDLEVALRCGYHEPLFERGLRTVTAQGAPAAGCSALVGALLGARDGLRAIPAAWIPSADQGTLRTLAVRLVRADEGVA